MKHQQNSGTMMADFFAKVRQKKDIDKDCYWPGRTPWRKSNGMKLFLRMRVTEDLREEIRKESKEKWKEWSKERFEEGKGRFYQRYIGPEIYSQEYHTPLKKIFWKSPRKILSKITQMRTQHGAFGIYFKRMKTKNKEYDCTCGEPEEDVAHILLDCERYKKNRKILTKVSPELDLKVLLDTKKGLNAVVEFLKATPQLLQ